MAEAAASPVNQRDIAKQIGVTQPTVAEWLKDSRTDAQTFQPAPLPPQALLDQIADDL